MRKTPSFRSAIRILLMVGLIAPLLGVVGPISQQAQAATPGSIYFDDYSAPGNMGSKQYIQVNPPIANTSLFNFSGNFTIELWVKKAARFATGYADIANGYGGPNANKWMIQMDNNGCFGMYVGAIDVGLTSSASCIPANTWTHVVVTRSSDNFLAFYVNGKLQSYKSNYSQTLGGVGSSFYIGDGPVTVTHSLKAQFSNIRVVNESVYGSLTHNESLGTQVFTSPTTALGTTQSASINISAITDGQTVLLMSTLYDGTLATSIADASGSGAVAIGSNSDGLSNSLTKTGYAPVPDVISPFITTTPGSFCLDNVYGDAGTRKTVSLDTAGLGPRTGDFTYELWFKNLMDSATNPSKISTDIIGTRDGTKTSGAGSLGFDLFYNFSGAWTSPSFLEPKIEVYQSPDNYSSSNARPASATWNHLVFERASGVGKIFLNGVLASSGADTRDFGSSRITLGEKWPLNNEGGFKGCISNFRYVKGQAVYSGNFTVPTSPLTATQTSSTNIAAITNKTAILLTTPYSAATYLDDNSDNAYVMTNNGARVSSDSPFAPPPSIIGLSVTSGIGTGGTTSVISGTNLSSASSVTVGGNAASIANNTSTAITITTPPGTDGAKNVVVTTVGGSATSVGAFTYFSKFAVSYAGGVGSAGTAPTQVSLAPNETFTVANGSSISKTGYTFSKWKDSGNVEYLPGATYTVTNATVTLTAQWTLNNYIVSFTAGAHGSISGTTPQTVDHGSSSSQVSAVPDSNYHFVNWSDASTVNPRTIASVETTTSLAATFAIDTYTATYSSGGNGSISGTAIQTINHGESATAVTAIPSANYHFVSWNDGVLTATRLDTSLTGSISKTASFAIDAHPITFSANGGSGGSTVSVNYNENAIASAPTVSKSQYTFAGWAETITASSIATWTVVGPKTLYSLWTPKVYTITYDGESGTVLTAVETFTVGNSPIQLQSATRAGYKFNGWYTDKTGGSLLGITGANYTPTDTTTVHAQWTQASLVGLSSPTSFGTIIATAGNDGGISATRSGTKAEVDYFADSLPDNTVITAYLQGSIAYAASQLTGVTNLLLSVVVAWKAPDETVPLVDPSKSAIRLKITNPSIKRGAKVYSITGDSSTIISTATQDGFVVIELREDPEIVIANPVEVPAPPAPPAPTPPSITAAPVVDNSAAENAAKLKAEEEAKNAAELKAAQEQAAKELQAAREKAEAEIKAAQDAADLEAKLKAEADARLAADLKAKADAEIAANLASQKIVPNVTLYSISPTLKLSVYDATYLKSYVATLKPKATVTCIGYIYPKNTTLAKAKLRATSQATAVCKLIKVQRKTLTTKVVIYPASKAPKAAAGAKWVAVSYRVDGFKS